MALSQHLGGVMRSIRHHLTQALFTFMCLPFEAYISLRAITRTLARIVVTHHGLLEWNTASEVDRLAAKRGGPRRLGRLYSPCGSLPAAAIATAAYLMLAAPLALEWAAPTARCCGFSRTRCNLVAQAGPRVRGRAKLTSGANAIPAQEKRARPGLFREL